MYSRQLMEGIHNGQCFQSAQSPVVLGQGSAHVYVTILLQGLVAKTALSWVKIAKHLNVTWIHAQVLYIVYM